MNIEKSIIANKKLIKNIFQITIPAVFDLLAQTLIMAFDMMMVASLGVQLELEQLLCMP